MSHESFLLEAACLHMPVSGMSLEEPLAKEAFQALSEAFEQLSHESRQQQLLQGKAPRPRAQAPPAAKAHWWDTPLG